MSTSRNASPRISADTGQTRAVVDAVLPEVDGGRFAAKCIAGAPFKVTAHAFADGHDLVRVRLRWRDESLRASQKSAQETEMLAQGNDVWLGSFTPPKPGRYAYTACAWVDHFESWRHDLARRDDPADIRLALQTGALLLEAAARRARGDDRKALRAWSRDLDERAHGDEEATTLQAAALDPDLAEIASRYPDRGHDATLPERPLIADRPRAGFSSWYELFPRSASPEPGRHGTFGDVEALVPEIAAMGFDVLYLPPIHPIGRERRKGTNNAVVAGEGDVGSPWAIGAVEGGHKSLHPALGTLDDFRRLVEATRAANMEVALDIAFQCAPDHPYVKQHPEWFRKRPDGSVQYAENPPKKYQDIFPFDFETSDWRALWGELKSVFDHWIAQGVKIFRVDNPHTKSFAFWEWVIGEIKREQPDVLFLAEAFTRPKVMHRLAKLGYSQSYTYFTWRNSKADLTAYFTELSVGPGASYFRPNVWPNTPDILHAQLQGGERAMYIARLVLAATLSANYGIYGPAYELIDYRPRLAGGEDYLDSEKYQLRHWDRNAAHSIKDVIARINMIRRQNAALQANDTLRFLPIDNDQLIAYVKTAVDDSNMILTIVNLDPRHPQSGWIDLDLPSFGIGWDDGYAVNDLLNGHRYEWRGGRNFVLLRPDESPAHVFRIEAAARTERDMDSFQ